MPYRLMPMLLKKRYFLWLAKRMRKRGFDMPKLVEKLHEKGIPVKAPTLTKYLNEFRRGKGKKAEGKTDTPPPPMA